MSYHWIRFAKCVISTAAPLGVLAIVLLRHPPEGEIAWAQEPKTNTEAGPPSYVGRQICAECHRENFEAHANHGHSATFFEVKDTNLGEIYAAESFDGGEGFGTYLYQTTSDGELSVTLRDTDEPSNLPLQFALGSGHNAQTLLTLMKGEANEGIGLEHRVTCYHGERLGLTVGHVNKTADTPLERFGDLVDSATLERCIYCHTTRADLVGDQLKNLVKNVNCEKCHGPGSEHVRFARLSQSPPPYSVGKQDWDTESEIQLCGDCHRLPRSLSTSELREYPDTLTRFQPVGMLMSACYLKSGRTLRCTTCHDPHQSVHQVSKDHHIKSCTNCHDVDDKSHVICPVNATSNCIQCHMPAIDQTQGIKFHDHWIRVRK